jgi:hypothetical protein
MRVVKAVVDEALQEIKLINFLLVFPPKTRRCFRSRNRFAEGIESAREHLPI